MMTTLKNKENNREKKERDDDFTKTYLQRAPGGN